MEQLEKDYLDLKQKYDKLKKHSAQHELAASLLLWMFPKKSSDLKEKEARETFSNDTTLIVTAYIPIF